MNGWSGLSRGHNALTQTLDLAVIGNGTIAALIDPKGEIVWHCRPRLDGDPVFNSLVGGEGRFGIELANLADCRQAYVPNTAIVRTVLEDAEGNALEIVDYAPRFQARGRYFRPQTLVRTITPIKGSPTVTVRLNPVELWGYQKMRAVRGISHATFGDMGSGFRVTTDAPLSYVMEQRPFILTRPISFVLGPDEPLSESPYTIARDWMERTEAYWKRWTQRLGLPLQHQDAVIRASITLKMCVYEETGGVVAALTTSIPEHAGSQRNWDYRLCWLRDAYFTVAALNRLSAVGTMEHYLEWLSNVMAQSPDGYVQPVLGVGLETNLQEYIVDMLPGYRGMGPVRRGNQAAEQIQHDVYGHMILATAQAFFDRRLLRPPGSFEFGLLERMGERAFAVHDQPDAGIWEYRTRARVHTSSALMCWAGCDRLAKIAAHMGEEAKATDWRDKANKIKETILERAWNDKLKCFVGAYEGDTLDASVLLMAEIGFLDPLDPRFVGTVDAVERDLRQGSHVFRYAEPDDFGAPETSFTVCAFWHVDALYRVGRYDEARELLDGVLARRNSHGLLSEDADIKTGELWGNFPQTYSMVGIINSASLTSRPWSSVV